MPLITRIVQQKDQNRANIYLDGKFAFGITLEALLKNDLHVNKELSFQCIDTLKKEDEQAKVYYRALDYATRRPHSEWEIKQWFKRKKIGESEQGLALFRLKKLNLVNDEEFAKWWVEQRTAFRPKSKRALKAELSQKGVKRDIIEEVLSESEVPEEEIAKKIAEKRLSRLKGLPIRDQKKKLTEFLSRRGFSWDIIKEVINQVLKQ